MNCREIKIFLAKTTICIAVVAIPVLVFGQDGCGKDNLGRIVCAPAGGSAISSLFGGVVCAPGKCVTDNLGYLRCSSELGGGAIIDNLGHPVCVGGCITPTKEYCEKVK